MFFKKEQFKNIRIKYIQYIIFFIILLIIPSFMILNATEAWEQWFNGYKVSHSNDEEIVYIGNNDGSANSGDCHKVINADATKEYFIPTKTQAEWNAFSSHKPNNITINNCCENVDGDPYMSFAGCGTSVDCDDNDSSIIFASDGTCDGDGDGYIDGSAGGYDCLDDDYNVKFMTGLQSNDPWVGFPFPSEISDIILKSTYFLSVGNSANLNADLIKFDYSGKILSKKQLAFNSAWDNIQLHSFIETSDGNFIAVGSLLNLGQDAFVVKFNSDLSVSWYKIFSGTNGDSFSDVIPSSDGNFLLFGNKGGSNPNGGVIIKMDNSKNVIWQKFHVNTYNLHEVKLFNDGNIVLKSSFHDFTKYSDGALIKINQNGGIIWEKHYGANGDEKFNDFVETSDGGIMVVGEIRSYSQNCSNNDASNDCSRNGYILRIDSSGNELWSIAVANFSDDYSWLNSIIKTSSGRYLAVGSAGGHESWLLEFDINGNIFKSDARDYPQICMNAICEISKIFELSEGYLLSSNKVSLILIDKNLNNNYPVSKRNIPDSVQNISGSFVNFSISSEVSATVHEVDDATVYSCP